MARRGRDDAARSPSSLLEVRLRGPIPFHRLDRLLQDAGAATRLIACRPTGARRARLRRLLDVRAGPEKLDALLSALRRSPAVGSVSAARISPDRAYLLSDEPMPSVCAAVFGIGGVCRGCALPGAPAGPTTWDVLVPRGSAGRTLLKALESADGSLPSVLRVRPPSGLGRGLTPHQDEVLRRAYDMGYFEFPRTASLGDVASALGMSKSAIMEVLRRGSSRLMEQRFRPLVGVPESRPTG